MDRPTCGIKCGGIYRRVAPEDRKKKPFICKDGYRMVGYGTWYIKEHRKVWQDILGRKLSKKEVVHHWDEDRLNNDVGNLALMRHQAAHKRIHLFAVRHGLKVLKLRFEQPWLN